MTYTLKKADSLPVRRSESALEYQKCVKDFLESGEPIMVAQFTDKRFNTVHSGLKNAIRHLGVSNKIKLVNSKKEDAVYLANLSKVKK